MKTLNRIGSTRRWDLAVSKNIILVASLAICGCTLPLHAKSRELKIAGFPPETPVSIELPDGSRFKIPAAYLSPWPIKQFFGKTNHWRSLSFSFWMPDKRWLERNPFFLNGWRPLENGRPRPTADQYVVNALIVDFISEKRGRRYVLPEQRLENVKRNFSTPLSSEESPVLTGETKEYFGLTELVTRPDYHSDYFHNDFSEDLQLIISCSNYNQKTLYQACLGYTYYKSLKLYFSFNFERDSLNRWKENASTIKDFILQWRE